MPGVFRCRDGVDGPTAGGLERRNVQAALHGVRQAVAHADAIPQARRFRRAAQVVGQIQRGVVRVGVPNRSEEHTSELQALMRISYAVFCLKKTNKLTKTVY